MPVRTETSRRTVSTRSQNAEKGQNKPAEQKQSNVQKETEKKEPVSVTQNPVVAQPARKKLITHKDLTMGYLMNGIDSIRPLLAESNDPVGQLDKVIETLKDGDQDTKDLEDLREYFDELNGVGQPGRRPVKTGDTREYTVQQQGDEGDFFVRIPVNTLGVQRGQKILASFTENKITIDVVMA